MRRSFRLLAALPLLALAVATAQAQTDLITALYKAARAGDLTSVTRLVEAGVPVDGNGRTAFTPLQIALFSHHDDVAAYLLDHGARATASDSFGVTPLHLVTDAKLASELIARGADVNAWSKVRATPLHDAVARDLMPLAKLLIAHGARLDVGDVNGSTPLHYAAGKGLVDMVRLLLDAGAPPDQRNTQGYTPLHWAAGNDHADVVDLLIDHKANLSAKSANGTTPLALAHAKGHPDMERLLRERGATE